MELVHVLHGIAISFVSTDIALHRPAAIRLIPERILASIMETMVRCSPIKRLLSERRETDAAINGEFS